MEEKLTRWDSAEFLDTEEAIGLYLRKAMERGNKEHILNCLSDAMRARNINQLAKDTGIDREKIYEMFSGAKAAKTTVVKAAKAVLGEQITAIFACIACAAAGNAYLQEIRGRDLQVNPGIAVQLQNVELL
jgi:probable addiction module antidote protein